MRIALVADTHLSARSPECVSNWHAARCAVGRLGADLTINLGDITLDGQTHHEELAFAERLMANWPTEVRCVPGNHDVGDGSGESPLDERLLGAYCDHFGPDRWAVQAGKWKLLSVNAQLLETGTAPAFFLPDDMQARIGEKLVGIGLIELGEEYARFDLWCPEGMKRHDVSALEFFHAPIHVVPTNAGSPPAVQAGTA